MEITKAYPGLYSYAIKGTGYAPVMVGAGFHCTHKGIQKTFIVNYDFKTQRLYVSINSNNNIILRTLLTF